MLVDILLALLLWGAPAPVAIPSTDSESEQTEASPSPDDHQSHNVITVDIPGV